MWYKTWYGIMLMFGTLNRTESITNASARKAKTWPRGEVVCACSFFC